MSKSESTRRGFLKRFSGIAAAGIAAPYVWTTGYSRADDKNSRLSVAAIGVGGRGSGIGAQAGGLGNMVACCDVDANNAKNFAKNYRGKCEIYADYRRVLDRKDIDAVTVGTPDHWHVKISIEAMLAGKDVYCEKPLTLTIDEGKKICKVVKQTKKVCQVGTQQRSEDGSKFLKAVALARSGRLGKKLKATASVGGATGGDLDNPFKTQDTPSNLNWDLWLGQAPKVPFCPSRVGWNFRWWLDYSGGQVTDWGVHHTDIAVWALGGDTTGIVEAEGKGDFLLGRETMLAYLLGKKPVSELPNTYNVARTFEVTMKLPNGNSIVLNSGDNDLLIEGDKGRIAVNRGHLNGKPVEHLSKADEKWLDEEVVKLYKGKQPGSHMGNFFACVKDRSLPISDVFTHVNSVNACHTANMAMLLGRKVRWDPVKQEFIGDAEANTLMSRKQRAPYTINA